MKAIQKVVVASLVASAGASAASDAPAAQVDFYLTITGAKQGEFKGTSNAYKEHNAILGLGFEYEVSQSAPNSTGGAATGKRQHSPFTITKRLDGTSPQLYEALASGEHLTVELDFVQATGAAGRETEVFSYKLTDAVVTDLREYGGTDAPVGIVAPDIVGPDLETFSLSFAKIEVIAGGKTFSDDVQTGNKQ